MGNKKGFTLVELIVVIAVLGILVLLASPKFMGHVEDAKLAQIKNDTKAHATQVTAELMKDKGFTAKWNQISQEDMEKNRKDMYNIRGKVKDDYPFKGEYLEIPRSLTDSIRSQLDGKFIYDFDKQTAYYIGDGSKINPTPPVVQPPVVDPPVVNPPVVDPPVVEPPANTVFNWKATFLPKYQIGAGTLFFTGVIDGNSSPTYFHYNSKFTVKAVGEYIEGYHAHHTDYKVDSNSNMSRSFSTNYDTMLQNPNIKAYVRGNDSISYPDASLFKQSVDDKLPLNPKNVTEENVYKLKSNVISSGLLKEIPLAEALEREILREDGGIILHNKLTGDFILYYINENDKLGAGAGIAQGLHVGQPALALIYNKYVKVSEERPLASFTGTIQEVLDKGLVKYSEGVYIQVNQNLSPKDIFTEINSRQFEIVN